MLTAAKERWRRQRPSPPPEGGAAAATLLVDQLAPNLGDALEGMWCTYHGCGRNEGAL